MVDDNITLRDREHDDENDEFERWHRQRNSENRALQRHNMNNNFQGNNIRNKALAREYTLPSFYCSHS